jgi:uncharacterized membrane protein YjjP (DUF1212 family)
VGVNAHVSPLPTAAEPEATAFVMRLARALHRAGYPAHWLEEVLEDVSARLGVSGEFFVTPTSIFASFGSGHTHLARVEPNEVDLGHVAVLDALVRDIRADAIGPREGIARIEALAARPRYGMITTALAFAVASATAARFLAGGARECLVAGVIGLILGMLAGTGTPASPHRRLFVPLAAFIAALVAVAAAHALGAYAAPIALLAGVIVLLPGLTLTVAIAELSTQHLAAGTARLAGAFVTFLTIGFGAGLGDRVIHLMLGPTPLASPQPVPAWTEPLALMLAPLAFTVLLRARRRDAPGILVVCVLAFLGGRYGAGSFGPELGICLGSFTAAAASILIERRFRRSAVITLVPAILLLVPGSVGFRSVVAMFGRDVVNGVDAAFRMFLMLCGLVAGVLAANAVLRKR